MRFSPQPDTSFTNRLPEPPWTQERFDNYTPPCNGQVPGAKYDDGKLEPSLIFEGFAHALSAVAAVATHGAVKYTRDGWDKVEDGQYRYTNAMYRHLLAERTEGPIDQDSEQLHAAHAAWNALCRLELILRGQ